MNIDQSKTLSLLGQGPDSALALDTSFVTKQSRRDLRSFVPEHYERSMENNGHIGEGRIAEIFKRRQHAPTVLERDNPVRDIAKCLRTEISEFIRDNLREPNRMGLRESANDPISVKQLKLSLSEASQKLEEIFNADQDRSAQGISIRTFAQNLQLSIDSFRVYLIRNNFKDGVGENHYDELIHMALNFKGELSSCMQEVDAYLLNSRQVEQESYAA